MATDMRMLPWEVAAPLPQPRKVTFDPLMRDRERVSQTVVGLHILAFTSLPLHRFIPLRAESP